MGDFKKGDIVKWCHSTTRPLRRGIIMKAGEWSLGYKWFQVFSFHSGQTVLKRVDSLTKVEDRGE